MVMIEFDVLYEKKCVEEYIIKETHLFVECFRLNEDIMEWLKENNINVELEEFSEKIDSIRMELFDLHFDNENDETFFRLTWL